ncbi:multiple C2 and transmembrane domain-containing protein 1 isoform X2 [Solea solea]|uniref:multiple C2 and transmembrane domain-containing protein 1 isoform X2 n=1 Tax=Solea solea TaxID=90069 RepID=UPI00272D0FEA|nr:multiple C2 and transmembrane domain-containing protein 1 isoform X2 [Solea solea]
MEQSNADESESLASLRNTIWKQLQAKVKPLRSPRLSSRERGEVTKRNTTTTTGNEPNLLSPPQLKVPFEAPLLAEAAGSGSKLEPESPETLPEPPQHNGSDSGGKAATEAETQLERRDEQPLLLYQPDSSTELRAQAGMEQSDADESESFASLRDTIWKQLQAKVKPLRSPRLGSRERGEVTKRNTTTTTGNEPNLLSPPQLKVPFEAPLLGEAAGSGSKLESESPETMPEPPQHNCSDSGGKAATEAETQLERRNEQPSSVVPCSSGTDSERPTPSLLMYNLEIELKRGHNLAIRDKGGSSDPYVKIKLANKDVFKSKVISKNLNPVWNEKKSLILDSLSEPLNVKVFDYDFGFQDDFIGSAYLHLDSLEQQRTIPVFLELKDPQYPDEDLGTLELDVTLSPKDRSIEECRESTQQPSTFVPEMRRKSQLWRGIVSIALLEGRGLTPMDSNGLSDPYVKFKLGIQKYRSKTVPKTLSPQWREQFDLNLFDEKGGVLEITVWDRDPGMRDDLMGCCQLDLSALAKEQTHRLELELDESRGYVVLLVTLTASACVSIADLSVTPLDDQTERRDTLKRYSLWNSFSNVKDVGIVQVKVLRAEYLIAADVTGKSDPFCVLELNNDRLQTHTVYKNLSPEWNKAFTFNVKDIHSVLTVTVLDEDRDRSADFLGKVAIPLLHVRNGEKKGYMLKDKKLTGPTKGVIYLEIDVIYNIVKAALRTVVPAEQKYMEEELKVSKQLIQQNFNRVKRCAMVLINWGSYVNSCFQWESTQRSVTAFVLFVVVVWNLELYMLPLALVLLLLWNYFFCSSRERDDLSMEAMFELDDEEEDKEDKDKGLMERLHAVQEVFVSVQNALDEVASYGERIKNISNWTVPFLSWLAITAFCLATVLLHLIPLRYLVLAWGMNKFTKKLRNPYRIDNNEVLDFLSRVPSDIQVMQYQQLKADTERTALKRRKTNPS